MRELDALAHAEEIRDMLADDIAAAHRRHTDLAARTHTDVTVAGMALDAIVIDAASRGDCTPDRECRSRRRVALGAVMGLDDFSVPVGTEHLCRLAHQTQHEVDPE